MKKFTALHISDAKLRRSDFQQEGICALFADIAAYRASGQHIDAIFFSGELVARDAAPDSGGGATPAYVYEQFLRPVLQAAASPGMRFYLVPGGRAPGGIRQDSFGGTGFSFFSTLAEAGAGQRAHYKNIHAVFHGHKQADSAVSLMNALGVLYKSNPGGLCRSEGCFPAYALLEFNAEPEPRWTVALRVYDEQRNDFRATSVYTPNGKETYRMDAEYVFATLLPRINPADGYIDGLLGKPNPGLPADETVPGATAARGFLIELALWLFEADRLALQQSELERFASDYCAVAGMCWSAEVLLDSLYQNGLLLKTDGQVAFQFDYFRTFFLAQRFETSSDLMRYGLAQASGPDADPESATESLPASGLALPGMPYLSRSIPADLIKT
ncbi:STAND family AAA ATPase [Janthinobacterium agaricidamnosum]|uniref:STAND NTPase 4 small alpha/beta domain-containing protein n=1 Tax=Janthinobacterium agaricidamnosum NBRC 102515 = DSM 9628 TaxID=1349767 RepID=W0UYW6_9BURK|nr:hypothetical protein [Janthinobacterium agaricidamnosum]CDG81759.1 hypothetical protein GJA_1105 [Janthinobacterium agaricidamnosum NBRC 102515 = DSM 9628]